MVDLGYAPGPPTDVVSDAEFPLDTIFFVSGPPGSQSQAEQVASHLGLGPEAALEMPSPPPAEVGLAAVLVVLGSQPGGLAEQAIGAQPATLPG